MTSKTKKSRKIATKSKLRTENADKSKYNPHMFFNADEIAQIKSSLRIKDVASVPAVVGCVILNKLDTLQKVLKHGIDINEVGPSNTTALIWAVKYKHLHLVDFLLRNGADPTTKTDNGEDMLITALEHKLWDESSFIDVWTQVNIDWNVDVNSTNKNGHSLLNIAVRRDWDKFVQILIDQKANVETANSNGVTALMAACCRGSIACASALLSAGACAYKEDHHRRTALCYAVVSGGKSSASRPPYPLADRLVRQLKDDGTFKDYVKSRIQVMHQIIEKEDTPENAIEMMISVLQYLVQFTDIGMKLLLEYKMFEHLKKELTKCLSNQEKCKFLLSIIMEIAFFNEQAPYFSPDTQLKIMAQFLESELPEICLTLLQEHQYPYCFYIFLLVCTSNELGQNWLKENCDRFREIFDKLSPECLASFNVDFHEEKRLKLMKKKIKKLKRTLNLNQVPSKNISPREELGKNVNIQPKEEIRSDLTVVSSKKTKRHTKALKAKMAKIKSLELSERLNLGARVSNESRIEENSANSEIIEADTSTSDKNIIENSTFLTDEESNPISFNLRKFLEEDIYEEEPTEDFPTENTPEQTWKEKISSLHFENCYPVINTAIKTDKKTLELAMKNIKMAASFEERKDIYIEREVEVVIAYLRELLQIIIFRFNYTWPHGLDGDFEHDFNLSESKVGIMKRQMTLELQRNFENLIISLRTLLRSPHVLLKQIYELERELLKFEVMRSEPLVAQLCPMEQIKVSFSHKTRESDKVILGYIEETLNGIINEREDIKVEVVTGEAVKDDSEFLEDMETYYEDIKHLSSKQPNETQCAPRQPEDTMKNAWHLEQTIEYMIVENEEQLDPHFQSSFNQIQTKQFVISPQIFPEFQENFTEDHGRWTQSINRLRNSSDSLSILNGDIIIGNPADKRNIISKWDNFKSVILAISCNGIPLAVKKLPKLNPICKRLKSIVIPLLGLRNTHILPYFACDYHQNDLFLATPLCEYHLGEYAALLKSNDNSNILGLTEMDIIRQILNGISFLHDRMEPITHGNLKPTNVFIEYNGVVKLAEFGILEVIYTLAEVPESAMIWFANETFENYKKTGILNCTLASDIQVAGMLIHYILSGGFHPFGDSSELILLTHERKSFTLIPRCYYKDQSALDLLQKMLNFDANQRPNIRQVLSHVMFWTNDRKWAYILTATGITTITPINVKDLHDTINRSAKQVRWVDEVKKKYPLVRFFAIDNTVGLLKFIRNFYEQTIISEQDVRELKSCVLENFPNLALFLHTVLENTKFHKHPAFIQFLTPDSTLTL